MTDNELRLLCVLAHPDDESLGIGGVLAHYAAEGVKTYLVTATRGEYGWMEDEGLYPGPEALGKIREAELLAAAQVLGLQEVNFLDYLDGHLDEANPLEAIAKIANHIRRIKPHVVLTFGPDGAYGHPDHIAICQFTTAALVAAADSNYPGLSESVSYRVAKFYYMADTTDIFNIYESVFGTIMMRIDGVERRVVPWNRWATTTRVDTVAHRDTVWQAVLCHHSQLPAYGKLQQVSDEHHQLLWGRRTFYRAMSLVNGGRMVEDDLFAGLR